MLYCSAGEFTILFKYFFILFLGLFLLTACESPRHFAPVNNGWKTSNASQIYRVQRHDTLYSIAFRYGLDVNQLATANNLTPPYHLKPGQKINLSLSQPQPVMQTPPVVQPQIVAQPQPVIRPKPVISVPVSQWVWPATGKIIQGYSSAYGGNKGINIAGKMGDPVRAAAAGQVVYCGSGLRGYGLLIIVKHSATYLSAYAHNSKALVKEGQKVKQNQIIAKMGNSDSNQVMLHFEIRQSGKPVDPLKLLPPR